MERHSNISEKSLLTSTGKTWKEWFAILDKLGAEDWTHGAIAAWLSDNQQLPSGWWAQGITVGYEQARGKRAVYQRADGTYSTSASKTLPIDQMLAFNKFCQLSTDVQLPFRVDIVHKNLYKRVSAHGPDDTRIVVNFIAKGPHKTLIQIDQQKIKTSEDREKFAVAWRNVLTAFV